MMRFLLATLALLLTGTASAQFNPATADPDAATVADNGDVFIAFLDGPTGTDVYRFARWDGTAWTAYDASIPAVFGPPPFSRVYALAATASGDALYVAGEFATATDGGGGTVAVSNIARLDLASDSWSAMGGGLDGRVNDIEINASGVVYAGGTFGASGGTTLRRVAMWDPGAMSWGGLGDGVTTASGGFSFVQALALDPAGDVVITGIFDQAFNAPGVPTVVENIAQFDASAATWQAFSDGLNSSSSVQGLETDGTNVIVVGGNLAPASGSIPGQGSVLRWDGSAWQGWQSAVPGTFMRSLAMDGQGTFYLVPDVFFPGRIYARQTGDPSWTLLGTESFELFEIVAANVRRAGPDCYLGGVYNQIDLPGGGAVQAQNHARWDGTRWTPLATGAGNTPPVITSLFGPTRGDEGGSFFYDANGFDLDGDPLTYFWDFGDGSPIVSGLERDTVTHVFEDDGTYTVMLTVSDGGLVDATATRTVTVNNVDPTLTSLAGDQAGQEGDTFNYTASATDPAGANDPLTYMWDFGDGSAPQSGVGLTNVSHVYANDGTYTLALTVTDGDGGTASGSLQVVVSDSPTGTPNVTIAVATTTTTIPAGGGVLSYTVSLTNQEATAQSIDVWLDITLPTGQTLALRPPKALTIGAGQTLMGTLNRQVPSVAPAGAYTVTGRVGDLATSTVFDSDTFTFDKAGARSVTDASEPVSAALATAMDETFGLQSALFVETVAEASRVLDVLSARPNPFAETAIVGFVLPDAAEIVLSVFDVRGREVAVLAEGLHEGGRHDVTMDGRGLPPGAYLVRLVVGETVRVHRVVLVR